MPSRAGALDTTFNTFVCRYVVSDLTDCPICGADAGASPRPAALVFDPGESGRPAKRKAETYGCPGCGSEFTVVSGGRRRLVMVPEADLRKMSQEVGRLRGRAEELGKKASSLGKEAGELKAALRRAKEGAWTRQLEARKAELQAQVDYLNNEKRELEQKLAKLS